jgi:hypothetical protein|tara:strand:- start:177 stop:494 length:318 start_codon:yes stop_codon:yes gene_type:complete
MIDDANTNETKVFNEIPSLQKNHVSIVKHIIPETNDANLPGQNNPSNPDTASLVASIKIYVIGIPNNVNANLYFFAQGQMIGPLTCIHTNDWPTVNSMIAKIINR